MRNSKVCQAVFGASVILACLCACDNGAKDKTSVRISKAGCPPASASAQIKPPKAAETHRNTSAQRSIRSSPPNAISDISSAAASFRSGEARKPRRGRYTAAA